jgi:hypothetical protein
MQLKCTYCSTPFALSNDQVAQAIEILRKDPHGHYDAHCPKCRRANKLPRKMFERYPQYRHMLESPEPPAAAAPEPAAEQVKEEAPADKPAEEPAGKPAVKKAPQGKKAG